MLNQTLTREALGPRQVGPNLGLVASVYVFLKIASVLPVSAFGMPFGVRPPFFPALHAPIEKVAAYFSGHATPVLLCAFLQIGCAIPFVVFSAAVASRLRFLGANTTGGLIALGAGLMAAFDETVSGAIIWTMGHPVMAQMPILTQALHSLAVALGGPGFTMPQGLLMAGISIPAGAMKLLPRWLVVFGLLLAATGELSWLSLMLPSAGILIPITRWLGFLWLIAVGCALPVRARAQRGEAAA